MGVDSADVMGFPLIRWRKYIVWEEILSPSPSAMLTFLPSSHVVVYLFWLGQYSFYSITTHAIYIKALFLFVFNGTNNHLVALIIILFSCLFSFLWTESQAQTFCQLSQYSSRVFSSVKYVLDFICWDSSWKSSDIFQSALVTLMSIMWLLSYNLLSFNPRHSFSLSTMLIFFIFLFSFLIYSFVLVLFKSQSLNEKWYMGYIVYLLVMSKNAFILPSYLINFGFR